WYVSSLVPPCAIVMAVRAFRPSFPTGSFTAPQRTWTRKAMSGEAGLGRRLVFTVEFIGFVSFGPAAPADRTLKSAARAQAAANARRFIGPSPIRPRGPRRTRYRRPRRAER